MDNPTNIIIAAYIIFVNTCESDFDEIWCGQSVQKFPFVLGAYLANGVTVKAFLVKSEQGLQISEILVHKELFKLN